MLHNSEIALSRHIFKILVYYNTFLNYQIIPYNIINVIYFPGVCKYFIITAVEYHMSVIGLVRKNYWDP